MTIAHNWAIIIEKKEVNVMAEFCLDCWNALNGFDDPQESYVMSWGIELCEGCGEWKRVVIRKRKHYLLRYFINRLCKRKK